MAKRNISKKDIAVVRSAIEKSIKSVLTDKFVKNAIERAVRRVTDAKRKPSKRAAKKTASKKASKRKTSLQFKLGGIQRSREGRLDILNLQRGPGGSGREPGPGPGH